MTELCRVVFITSSISELELFLWHTMGHHLEDMSHSMAFTCLLKCRIRGVNEPEHAFRYLL